MSLEKKIVGKVIESAVISQLINNLRGDEIIHCIEHNLLGVPEIFTVEMVKFTNKKILKDTIRQFFMFNRNK